MPTDLLNQSDSPLQAEDTRPATFFKQAYQTFQKAEHLARGSVHRFYTIGGYTVHLRFAGPALIPYITPALEHLATESVSVPALTVCLWDSVSTNTELPPPPWSLAGDITRGETHGYIVMNTNHVHTIFELEAGTLCLLDTRLNLAIFWVYDFRQLPYYYRGAPLRIIMHHWTRNCESQLVHAAAVGTFMGGVLLAGKSGVGKSTTALACLSSELLYVGDDYVLLNRESPPFVYSLYNSAKLDADHIEKLPHLLSAVSNSKNLDAEKALIFLHNHYPDKLALGFPVQAILVPNVTGLPETRLKKTSPTTSLIALAPSTIFQLPGARHKVLQNLSKFVKQVPNYILEVGTDLSRIPDVILSLLSEG